MRVKGGQVCPWCLKTADDQVKSCGSCGTPWPGDDAWPVVRTLAAGGVDRFSLGARLEAMSPSQARGLAAAWSAQAAVVDELARTFDSLEALLIGRGYGNEFRREHLLQLPLSGDGLAQLRQTAPPLEDTTPPGILAAMKKHEWHPARPLMALAVVRAGLKDEDAESLARGAGYGNAMLAMEAAAVFALWRHADRRSHLYRHDAWEVIEAARAAVRWIDHARFRPYAAVALRRLRDDRAALLRLDDAELKAAVVAKAKDADAAVADALKAPGRDLRLTAALLLGDEATLLPFTKDNDPAVRDVALARYAALGTTLSATRLARLREELAAADEAGFRYLVRKLPGIEDAGVLAILAEAYAKASAENRREIVRHVVRGKYEDLPAERRDELLAWLGKVPLAFAEGAELTRWALDGRGATPASAGPAGAAFVMASSPLADPFILRVAGETGRALRAMPSSSWPAARDAYGFREWLSFALRTGTTHLDDLGPRAEPFLDAITWLLTDEGMAHPVLTFVDALWTKTAGGERAALAHALHRSFLRDAWRTAEEDLVRRFTAHAARDLAPALALFRDHLADVYEPFLAAAARDAAAMIPLYERLVVEGRLEPYDLASRIWPALTAAEPRAAFLAAVRAAVLALLETRAVTGALPPFKLLVRAICARLAEDPRDEGFRALLADAEAAWRDIVVFCEAREPDGWRAHYFTSTEEELRNARAPVQKCDEAEQERTTPPPAPPEPVSEPAASPIETEAPTAPTTPPVVSTRPPKPVSISADILEHHLAERARQEAAMKAAQDEIDRQRRAAELRGARQKALMEDFQKQSREVSLDPNLTPEQKGTKLQQLALAFQQQMQQLGE